LTNRDRGGYAMARTLSIRFFAIDLPNGPVVTTGPVHQTLPSADPRLQASVTFSFLQAQGRRASPAEHGGYRAAHVDRVLTADMRMEVRGMAVSRTVVYHRDLTSS